MEPSGTALTVPCLRCIKKLSYIISELLSVLVQKTVSRVGKDLQPRVGNSALHYAAKRLAYGCHVFHTCGRHRRNCLGMVFCARDILAVIGRDHEVVMSLSDEDWN